MTNNITEIKNKLCDIIEKSVRKALQDYRLMHQADEDGYGLPLVDALSSGYTIATGNQEIEMICDSVFLTEIENEIEAVLQTKLTEQEAGWRSMDSAPLWEVLFVCRNKANPHVTFEAMIHQEQESWEIPEFYKVLQNMTIDEPIDGDWDDYEWKPIAALAKLTEYKNNNKDKV